MRGGSDGHCPALAEGGVEALCRAPTPSEYSSCAYAPRGDPFAVVSLVFSRFLSRYVAGPGREDLHRVERARDRKSTRLNSSHSQISYAVFCLKKKKVHI